MGDDEDIDRHSKAAEHTPQPYGFLNWIGDGPLDDEDIDIGSCSFVAASTGAKEHDPGMRRGRLTEPSTDFCDYSVV
jgi:hypothetical protein